MIAHFSSSPPGMIEWGGESLTGRLQSHIEILVLDLLEKSTCQSGLV